MERQDELLREKIGGLDGVIEYEIEEEEEEESNSEARRIADIIWREGKPKKSGGFADRNLEWE